MTPDVLLVGCGSLGAGIGLRLAAHGHTVLAIRRRAELVPPPLLGLSSDLTAEVPQLPGLDLQYLVVALTARPRSEAAYRATYVDGMRRALDALDAAGQVPRRAVLVSSTSVYGSQPHDAMVDEDTPAHPANGPGRMLLEAERLFSARIPHGTVLRLSGLYGGPPGRLQAQVLAGDITEPNLWTNRIHRDDATTAVVHLLTLARAPNPFYIGTDDEPALFGDVAAHLAHRLGAPAPPATDLALATGKRLSNARLRATCWVPTYPSYREGYS